MNDKLSDIELEIIELQNLHKVLKTYASENCIELMPLIECIDEKYEKINKVF